jgi:hypothetical protein
MAENPNDLVAIGALSPNHVAAYLSARGWVDEGVFGAHGRRYASTADGEKHELILPTRPTLTDFTRRMTELIDDLAQAEKRATSSVLFDLTLTAFDVIGIRSRDADEYGSVRFNEGVQLCEEAANLFVASARAAFADAPKRAWKGRRPESINEYLQRVRLGQTERSSFSLTVLSPYAFDPPTQVRPQIPLFAEDAFGRRVTRKFGTALQAIEQALSDAIPNPIPAFEHSVQAGVSAELCEALANLADNDVGIEVSVSWSPAKPVPHSQGGVRLALTPRDATVLKEVARVFTREEPEPDKYIEGIITQIAEDPHTFDGSTTVEAVVDGRLRRVHVQFSLNERDFLIDAFKNRARIKVQGELISEGNRLKLNGPRGLTSTTPEN